MATVKSGSLKALLCPTCRKVVLTGSEDFPFCSDRCRVLDLGKWASGDYKVPLPVEDSELLEDLARRLGSQKRRGDEEA